MSDERSPLVERTREDPSGCRVSSAAVGSEPGSSQAPWAAAGTWGWRPASPGPGRRRAQSWSEGPPDDVSSEVRILRERLVRTQTRPRPGAMRRLTRRQRLTLASLALVDFMSFCSMSVMAPFFPGEASGKGLTETITGFVFSFYAVVMFITSPILGKCDIIGYWLWSGVYVLVALLTMRAGITKRGPLKRGGSFNPPDQLPMVGAKFMFITGMFVAGCCNIVFGSLALIDDPTMFTALCLVVRGLAALGAGAYSTASYVFVVHAFPDCVGSVLGILETFVGLGMSVGPAIGGMLYSIGGFGLPFYTLGVIMIFTVPINFFLLTDCDEYMTGTKSASIFGLFRIPSIIITGLVIVVVSNTWAFLDPTLEPHLRQFGLSTKQIGLVFLLFSSLYGIFSPIWGWVADRVHNHWCMMVWGLFLTTVGLLLLGPCPFIPGVPTDLWLDLVALSILSISVALTLLPTFQGVLASSIDEGGCPEAMATYSAVAGVWSCCYSLGEVTGPAVGGALVQRYGFPLGATICAGACFTMAVVALTFFSLRESSKWVSVEWGSSSLAGSGTWSSAPHSAPASTLAAPLPRCDRCDAGDAQYPYSATPPIRMCLKHKSQNKSGSASIADVLVNFLKFQYVTDAIVGMRRRKHEPRGEPSNLYQDYMGDDNTNVSPKDCSHENNNTVKVKEIFGGDKYCSYLENTIFGNPNAVLQNVNLDNLMVKKNHGGLMSKINEEKTHTEDIIRHNIEKVNFYEKKACSLENVFNACACKDGVTYARGTVAVSSSGACEV